MTLFSRDLSESMGAFYLQEKTVTLPMGGAWEQVLTPNPLRWAIIFGSPNNGAGTWAVSTVQGNKALANVGFFQGTALEPLILTYDHHAVLTQSAWYAAATSGGAAPITIIEVIAQQ